MIETWIVILIHQLIFQGMFITKNILLRQKTGKQIRGKNIEATVSIAFFALFILMALALSFLNLSFGTFQILNHTLALGIGLALLFLNCLIAILSLLHLSDSWRVGVLEDQKTELITNGIYTMTRNPYFVSYFLMFAAYTILLQNVILLGLSLIGFLFVHSMILKEEKFLISTHGNSYLQYKSKVPRYLFF